MAVSLRGRDFLSIHEWSREELEQVLRTAEMLKIRQKAGLRDEPLRGKVLAMYFEKPSLRTRVSFEVAMHQLGGHALYLSQPEVQLGRRETIADTARTLSRYVDGIMVRTFAHGDVVELARHATVPVINGLTDLHHPCQALGDIFTIYEKFGRLEGITLAYVGDGNNVANSLLHAGAKFGMRVRLATPGGYMPPGSVVEEARRDAERHGATIELMADPAQAVRDADVVYSDVWVSMGQEKEAEVRRAVFQVYQVNAELMRLARPGAVYMHCLPAHHGEEVTDDVFESPQSIVFDQAENRLHVQKAILALVMG